jgi:hypothetical protein
MKNPSGLCMCGCGSAVPLSKETRRGYKRGEPLMYMRGHNRAGGPDFLIQNGCWVWRRSLTTHGYGHLVIQGKDYMAHRLYYERFRGEIPKGLELHHTCSNRACVNPDHLQPMTRREHMVTEGRRAFGRWTTKRFQKDAES